MIYTSELAVMALGLTPTGTRHSGTSCNCAMCKRRINEGNLSTLKALPKTFMDFGNLAPSDYLCGFCATTSRQTTNRELQRSVITARGIYNINTDSARAWFWLTPPEPPYSVVINHSTMAAFHYHWRTPVTLNNDLVQLNVDDVLYQVRRQRLLKAMTYAQQLVDSAPALAKKKSVMKTPFKLLSRSPTASAKSGNGVISQSCHELAKLIPSCNEAIAYLQHLSPGELVALSPLFKGEPALPTEPPFITSLSR